MKHCQGHYADGERRSASPPSTGMITRQREPKNLETSFDQLDWFLSPTDLFYIRSHFPAPKLDLTFYRLSVNGAVRKPVCLDYEELRGMHSETRVALLECAGNSRVFLVPQVEGAQWELGAVGNAEWAGVSLRSLLDRAGLQEDVCEIVLEGADRGMPKEQPVAEPEHDRHGRSIGRERSDLWRRVSRPDAATGLAREALKELHAVGAFRRLADQFVEPLGVGSYEDAPPVGLDPVEDDSRRLCRGRWSVLAKAAFALGDHLPNVFVGQIRNVSSHRGEAGAGLRDLRRLHRVRLITALDLARICRDRRSDVAGHDDRALDGGALIRRSVISASVKPFSANFAAQYAVCGTLGPIEAQKPLTLLVLTMWPSSALCSIGRKVRVQL
jgi:Oxidoreductase molybdopterin binding domain